MLTTTQDSLDSQQPALVAHLGYNLLGGEDGVDEGCGGLSMALGYGTGAVDNHVLLDASGEVFPPAGLQGTRGDIRPDPGSPPHPAQGAQNPTHHPKAQKWE